MHIPLVGQSYPARSAAAGVQETVNLYPEMIEDPNEKSKNVATLYGCPGRHLLASVSGTVRGLWSDGVNRLFVAHGTSVTEFNDESGTPVSTGVCTGAVDSGEPVQMFGNGDQLLILMDGLVFCDSGSGPVQCRFENSTGRVATDGTGVTWISGDKFTTDGTWTGKTITINAVDYTIADLPDDTHLTLSSSAGVQASPAYAVAGDPVTGTTGGYVDGYFIVARPNSRYFNLSDINDGNTWSSLDFGRKDGYADKIRGMLVDNQQAYFFGHETIEAWQDTGNVDFPFQRIPGAMARFGSRSAFAQVSLDGQVYFLGGDDRGQVSAYVIDGFTPKRISTHAEESAWGKAGLGANAVAYCYMEEGHSFWVINFGSQTWAYDPGMKMWHERRCWSGTAWTAYQTKFHAFLPAWSSGRHVTAGDTVGGNVYLSSIDFYDDNGSDIKWSRTLPYIHEGGVWVYFSRLTLEIETGTVASGAAPVVTLDSANDRGRTFTNPRTASLGAHDAFSLRVFWMRCGKSRGRNLRFSGVGQSKVALISLDGEIAAGTV